MSEAKVVITAQDRASAVLRGVQAQVSNVQSAFVGLAGAGAVLGAGALYAGLKAMVGAIDDLADTAQGLGITAVELSNLRIAAQEAGIGADQFDGAITKLNVKISEAASGSKEAQAYFSALGIKVRDAAGNVRPTTEVLGELADKFSTLEDGPSKAALAVEIFGKAGAKLIPLLNGGAAGLQRFSGLTKETVAEAERLQAEFDRSAASVTRFKNSLLGGVLPALNDFIEGASKLDISKIFGRADQRANDRLGYITETFAKVKRDRAQVEEALKLGAGAYSNEGRAATQSAQAVLDKARADIAGTKAVKDKASATRDSSNAYAAEFRDVQRIRDKRKAFDDEQEDQANRERERNRERLRELTGQEAADKQLADLKLLDDAFFEGSISAQAYDNGLKKAFGKDNVEKIAETKDLVQELGLTIASSLGEWITSGGSASDFIKALGQDVLKLTTQLLILEPLAKSIKSSFGGGSGSGDLLTQFGTFAASLFGGGQSFAGVFAGGGTLGAGQWGIAGEAGPEIVKGPAQIVPNAAGNNITINVQGNADARTANQIAAAVARQLTIANRRYN